MANKYKGEVKLKLGGKELILRPTFGALAEIEDRSGKYITEIFGELERGRVSIKVLAVIISSGAAAANPDEAPTLNEAGDAIRKDGMLAIMKQRDDEGHSPLAQFLLYAITGDEKEPVKQNPPDPEPSAPGSE